MPAVLGIGFKDIRVWGLGRRVDETDGLARAGLRLK